MNDKLSGIWKESAVAYFEVISRIYLKGMGKSMKNLCEDMRCSPAGIRTWHSPNTSQKSRRLSQLINEDIRIRKHGTSVGNISNFIVNKNVEYFLAGLYIKLLSHFKFSFENMKQRLRVIGIYLLTYGDEPFLRSLHLCSHSGTSQQF
jgi:hypothetical protein